MDVVVCPGNLVVELDHVADEVHRLLVGQHLVSKECAGADWALHANMVQHILRQQSLVGTMLHALIVALQHVQDEMSSLGLLA
eukprot:1486427-Pyramimonas_sp.AAC.1